MEYTRYFISYEGYFWQWEEEDRVLAIPGGSTIAYEAFMLSVLEKLSDSGLPHFGSLLLTIIATNQGGKKSLDQVHHIVSKKVDGTQDSRLLLYAMDFLHRLTEVPKIYKTGKNRVLLLHALFSESHNRIAADKSKQILDHYRSYRQRGLNFGKESIFPLNVYTNDFRAISLLGQKYPDVDSLLKKLADLPTVDEELDIEKNTGDSNQQKDFVDELIENNKTSHVGSLIKRLWSGLNIPFHNYLPSHQPVGGVSDLTNKGELHRLLISEFANDDLLFLSRLANNEALYINREVPPDHQEPERVILIDISMKSWGTPRIVAFALALAIAKHPKTDIHCSIFAVGSRYHPVSFQSINDTIEGLQILEAGLHPADGLESFFKEYSFKKKTEIFLIASRDSFRYPALHKCISDHYGLFNYWITTDALGNVDIDKRQQNSKRHIQHLQLPLEEAWKKREPKHDNLRQPIGAMFPILFPVSFAPKRIIPLDEELFLVTAEKSLLRLWNKEIPYQRGWEMIMEFVPMSHGEIAIGKTSDGEHLLLVFNNLRDRTIEIINLTTMHRGRYFFNEWRKSVYNRFIFYNDRFYYAYLGFPSQHWTFELGDEIVVNRFENIPKEITDLYKEKESELKNAVYSSPYFSILKNIKAVYINQVGNLVFNNHELRLNEHGVVTLSSSGFKEKKIIADVSKKGEFVFSEGSIVKIIRAGLIILKSSDPEIPTLYIPSAIDISLGVATKNDFAGNAYFFNSEANKKTPMDIRIFWRRYLEPFINNIKAHATAT